MLKKFSYPVLVLAGFGLGWLSFWISTPPTHEHNQSCFKTYPFISYEIDCTTIDETANQIDSLQKQTQNIIDEETAAGHITKSSVFFRDLNSRKWFGINDTVTIHPASLIKLPVAMMYYKVAELDSSILNQELAVPTEDANDNQSYQPPKNPLTPGKSYAIHDMIEHMLKYSDNAPFSPLMDASKIFHNKILTDLGVYQPATDDQPESWNITTKSYANMFRTLYNASYLNVGYSNTILETLSQSTFKDGIVAGIPFDVRVAHKFGEGTGVTEDGKVETSVLNDCGIVYKKDAPYILCVMTEGKDFPALEKVIQRIAKTSYEAL